jgi:hypothetical protein
MPSDGTGESWIQTNPLDGDAVSDGPQEIRDLRIGAALRLNKEHETLATGTLNTGSLGDTGGGEHRAGSGKAYVQDVAPTTRPDGVTTLDSDDMGRLLVQDNGTVNPLLSFINAVGDFKLGAAAIETGAIQKTAGTDSPVVGWMPDIVLMFSNAPGSTYVVKTREMAETYSLIEGVYVGGSILFTGQGFNLASGFNVGSTYFYIAIKTAERTT